MSHPSRSLSGRMSVGVQSDPTELAATQIAAWPWVRAGVASNSETMRLIDDKGESLFDTQSDASDLRVNEYTAYSRRQLFANAAIAASRVGS